MTGSIPIIDLEAKPLFLQSQLDPMEPEGCLAPQKTAGRTIDHFPSEIIQSRISDIEDDTGTYLDQLDKIFHSTFIANKPVFLEKNLPKA